MLRIENTPPVDERLDELAGALRDRRERLSIRFQEFDSRDRLLAGVLDRVPESVYVRVPTTADQAERVILDIATTLGQDVAAEVDGCLVEEPDTPARSLQILRTALGERPLVVDGWDKLKHASMDRDIGRALSERTRSVRSWLGESGRLFAFSMGAGPDGTQSNPLSFSGDTPPVQLANGAVQDHNTIWREVAPNTKAFELGLVASALGYDSEREELGATSPDVLRGHIFEYLPEAARAVLARLAIHARVLPEASLEGLAGWSQKIRSFGLQLGLWRSTPGGLSADAGWTRWWRMNVPKEERSRIHLDLAQRFARESRPDEPGAGHAALALLEAHRHYLLAGEIGQAQAYARYGAGLLVEAARRHSQAGRYAEAAHLYEGIVEVGEEGSLPVGQKLHAYAQHYLHFNRARAELESMEETERGYRSAIERWPTNALFWSRLVRVLFYRQRREAAFQEFRRAMSEVPEHPQKETVLIARTVRGLLRWEAQHQESGSVLDAILIWGDATARTPVARDVQEQLAQRLSKGWQTRRIHLHDQRLVFTRHQVVTWDHTGSVWFAGALDAEERGGSPLAALSALVEKLREETSDLVRAYTHQLGPEDRLRKQRLLSTVHLIASELVQGTGEATWVFGDLERAADGTLWLRTGGSYDLCFEVPPELVPSGPLGDYPRFAKVKAGPAGEPIGPVIELDEAFRQPEEALWEAWERRTDAG